MNWGGRYTSIKDMVVKRLILPGLLVFLFVTGVGFTPERTVFAQDSQDCGVPDASGAVTPCPPESGEDQGGAGSKRTATPVPPTTTFTPTETSTSTPTRTPTSSRTPSATTIPETATPSFTPTATLTATPTPVPLAQSIFPGAGIGVLILFFIIGLLLPAIQKMRVARRGY